MIASVLAIVLAVAPAQAQAVATSGCDEALGQQLEAALAVELVDAEPEVVELAEVASLSTTCTAERVSLRAEAPDGRYAGQDVPLEVGAARRAAITLLELLRSLAFVAPTPPPPPPGARSLLVASGGVAVLGDPLVVLGGGGLALRLAVDPLVVLALAIDGSTGGLDVAPGQLALVLGQAAASVRFGGRVGDVQLHAGPLVSGALVSWAATARSPDVLALATLGPRVAAGIVASASYLLAELVALDVELSVDGAFIGSDALSDAVVVASTLGPSFAARIGLGWVLP